MTTTADSVEVRVYNVGFGDCILLTFLSQGPQESKTHRVLIDFGSTGRNSDGPNMLEVAEQIVEDCRVDNTTSQLDAIVVTHRHRDHMAGFGGEAGRYLVEHLTAPPKLIMQPWTENPKADDPQIPFHGAASQATKHVKSLRMAQTITASILKEIAVRRQNDMGRATDDEALFYGLKNLPFAGPTNAAADSVLSADDVLNEEGLKNDDAIERLQSWKKGSTEPKYEYLQAKQESDLGQGNLIPNLKVDVLGPVGPEYWDALKKHGAADELWKRLDALRVEEPAQNDVDVNEMVAFDGDKGPYGVSPIFSAEYQVPNTEARKDNVRWLVKRLDALRGRQLLNFVRVLDSHLNNTSLVLLFEFGNFRLLFPGDAEVASWQLISTVTNEDGTRQDDEVVSKLKEVDLYKVGHHGSDNATPKQSLWRHMVETRGEDHPLHCVLSTQLTKFKGKIPNPSLYQTMETSDALHLISTALPEGATPLAESSDWKAHAKNIGGKEKVMAYARSFHVGT